MRNLIYCGDCKKVLMHHIKNESVDLVYVDPPFFSGRQYELIWGNGYELKAYEDRWKGGIENYISWMRPKIIEIYNILKKDGSFYLHCDYRANARLRILLDEVFGENNFRNEIIWAYRTGGSSKRYWSRKHDTIYFYTKGSGYKFNMQKEKAYTKSKSRKAGIIDYGGGMAEFHEDESGVYNLVNARDIWEIPYINSQAKERLGYPTQKPEALLERIIKASSNKGDLVLDPMAGGGTTLAVAQKLGRKWIGIDVSPLACKLTARRVRKIGAKFELIGMPMSITDLKKLEPFAFQNWVIEQLYGHPSRKAVGDMGIDGFALDGRPVQVKRSERVGRPTVDNFSSSIRRIKHNKGIIVAFSFTKGANEEVARLKNKEDVEIELKTVNDILIEMGVSKKEMDCLEYADEEG
jgi:DNA modification methylase